MRIPSSRVSVICSWVATLTFMAGFMVFIIQPWTWSQSTLGRKGTAQMQAPLAQGLQAGLNILPYKSGTNIGFVQY